MKYFKKHLKGFTLLETLASIAVISLVVIGPLAVTISSSGYARLTKDTIVATYLAEEAVELLQNQYDSMYIYCKKYASSTVPGGYCDAQAAPDPSQETTSGKTAWRLFKDKLSGVGGQVTCFLPKNNDGTGSYPDNAAGNENGCAFDYINLQASSTQQLVRYDAASTDCKYLVPAASSTRTYVVNTTGGGQYEIEGDQGTDDQDYEIPTMIQSTTTITSYVCSGVPANLAQAGNVQPKEYVRTVTIDQLPTFESGVAANEQYNDDLRVTSSVQFKGLNGVSHTIKIVRFMHAKP